MADATASLFVQLRGDIGDLQQKMSGAVSTLATTESKISGIANNISGVINTAFAVAGVTAVTALAGALGGLAERGEKVSDLTETFNAVGGSASSLNAAKDALFGTVKGVDLMQIATKGLAARIPNFNKDFAEISVLGAKAAKVLGVDTKEAIDDLVSSLAREKPIGIVKQMGISIPTIENFRKVFGEIPEETDSASKAIASFENTVGEIGDTLGMAINDNESLRAAFRDLDEQIKMIDWQSLFEGIAKIASIAIEAAGGIVKLGNAIGDLINEAVEPGSTAVDEFQRQFTKFGQQVLKAKTKEQLDGVREGIQGMVDLMKANPDLIPQYHDNVLRLTQKFVLLRDTLPETTQGVRNWGRGVDEAGKAAANARKEIEKIQEDLNKKIATINMDDLKGAIKKSIDSLNAEDFGNLFKELYDATYDSSYEGFQKAINAGLLSPEKAAQLATLLTEKAVNPVADEWVKKMSDANQKIADDLKKKEEAVAQAFSSFFGDIFSEFADTGTIDWGKKLTSMGKDFVVDFATGFATQLATKIGGGFLEGLLKPDKIGAALADALSGGLTAALLDKGSPLGSLIDKLGLGKLLGWAGSLFATGGVFDGSSVQKAATGMVVSQPTMFMHGRGMGVMGEAGPEAILPLTRVNGVLGVQSTGGGTHIVINAPYAQPGAAEAIRREMDKYFDTKNRLPGVRR